MDEILTAIDSLESLVSKERAKQEEGTLPFRLMGFVVKNTAHTRRIVKRIKSMNDSAKQAEEKLEKEKAAKKIESKKMRADMGEEALSRKAK